MSIFQNSIEKIKKYINYFTATIKRVIINSNIYEFTPKLTHLVKMSSPLFVKQVNNKDEEIFGDIQLSPIAISMIYPEKKINWFDVKNDEFLKSKNITCIDILSGESKEEFDIFDVDDLLDQNIISITDLENNGWYIPRTNTPSSNFTNIQIEMKTLSL